jgi:hypothetical protein
MYTYRWTAPHRPAVMRNSAPGIRSGTWIVSRTRAAAPYRRSEREEHVAARSAARSDVSIEPIGRLLTAPPEPAKSPLSHIVLDPQAYRA